VNLRVSWRGGISWLVEPLSASQEELYPETSVITASYDLFVTKINNCLGNRTNFMEQSPSWEADSHSASQEIPLLLWDPKVHFCIHKSPLPL
jgi:hypothetical protein